MSTPENREPNRRHLVALAIDNNRQAWYEMVIPFIVSLRATGYRGRIGVIGYGLSAEKQQRLLANGIEVYTAVGVGALPYDRYISAAAVFGASPELHTLALYDADIWFPGPHFDIFDVVPDDDHLHVAPDAHFCEFVTSPIVGERKEALKRQCIQDVLDRLKHPLQAGLVVGGRVAWERFAQHVHEKAGKIGQDFAAIYGLDTTFLHLWGGLGNVRLLGCEQNFVTKWGLHERHDFDTGQVLLEHRGASIRGLHMTGDIRYLNRWRYLSRDAPRAMELGQALALELEADAWEQPAVFDAPHVERFASIGLALVAAHEDVLPNLPRLAAGISFRNPQGCALNAWAPHRVEFAVTCERAVIDISLSHLTGQPSAMCARIEYNGEVHPLEVPHSFTLGVKQGGRVVLSALSLPGQACHTVWDIVMREPDA